MQHRAIPNSGDKWSHYKNPAKVYEVMGISGSTLIENPITVIEAIHVDDSRQVLIYKYEDGQITLVEKDGITVIPAPHVIYFDANQVFARLLEEFMDFVPRFKKVS